MDKIKEDGIGGGVRWDWLGVVEGWGENVDNCNWIKILKNKRTEKNEKYTPKKNHLGTNLYKKKPQTTKKTLYKSKYLSFKQNILQTEFYYSWKILLCF